MKKLTTKWFKKWSTKAGLANPNLLEAITNLEKGLSTSSLGANLYKIRVNRSGSGKRSSYRTIIVYKQNDRAIFLYGFGKNEKGNITSDELYFFKKLGRDFLDYRNHQLTRALKEKVLFDLEEKNERND